MKRREFITLLLAAQLSQRQGKVLGGSRVYKGSERLIGGWLDHNLAAQAVAVIDNDLLLRTYGFYKVFTASDLDA